MRTTSDIGLEALIADSGGSLVPAMAAGIALAAAGIGMVMNTRKAEIDLATVPKLRIRRDDAVEFATYFAPRYLAANLQQWFSATDIASPEEILEYRDWLLVHEDPAAREAAELLTLRDEMEGAPYIWRTDDTIVCQNTLVGPDQKAEPYERPIPDHRACVAFVRKALDAVGFDADALVPSGARVVSMEPLIMPGVAVLPDDEAPEDWQIKRRRFAALGEEEEAYDEEAGRPARGRPQRWPDKPSIVVTADDPWSGQREGNVAIHLKNGGVPGLIATDATVERMMVPHGTGMVVARPR